MNHRLFDLNQAIKKKKKGFYKYCIYDFHKHIKYTDQTALGHQRTFWLSPTSKWPAANA